MSEVPIQVASVTKRYGGRTVLDAINLEVRTGETLVILGGSGSGKSTLLRLMIGNVRPDGGSIIAWGHDVCRMSDQQVNDYRKSIGVLFQSGALFDSLTVGENVAYPLRERALRDLAPQDEDRIQQRVDQLLEVVELENVKDLRPSDLSTGMKRAVAIARALAAEPEAILFDEPTTMVDPIMAITIADLILKLKRRQGITSVVVTHDMKLARKLADRVVFLLDGRVAFFGPVNDLDAAPEPVIHDFIQLDEVSFLK